MSGLVLAVIAISVVVTGGGVLTAAWRRLDGEHDLSPAELAAGAAVTGLGMWLAIHWALALTHTFTRTAVTIVAALFVLGAAALVARHWPRLHGVQVPREIAFGLLVLLPLFLWTIIILWRSTVLPPLSHDALAYHLPKALMMVRAGGYERFAAPDPRIGSFPANYELLLADVLLLSGSDALTEWIGTVTFLLFLIATAALAWRWWGRARAALAAVLATCTAPVVLLHSGADKNDLLVAFFSVTALLFGARWYANGGRMPMALLIVSLVCGVGAKVNLAAVLLGLAPFLIAAAVRRGVAVRPLLQTALFAVAVFLLCGGWSYVTSSVGMRVAGTNIGGSAAPVPYGDWFNYWQFPLLLLSVPYSISQFGVYVPWEREYWFWPHYELYWSHYGFLFTPAVLLLPVAVWLWRRAGKAAERRVATFAALIALAIMLPAVTRPIGFFGTYPRYFLFIVPIVFGWTVAPLAALLPVRPRNIAIGVLTLFVVINGSLTIFYDRFAPLEFVVWATKNPGTRAVWFHTTRAASVVDWKAGDDDTIAVDGGFDTWIWPAYGPKLSRKLVFLPPNATARDVPAAAQWVIIDRSYSAFWNAGINNAGKIWGLQDKARPAPADLVLYESLRADPRFKQIFRDPRVNQAVFRRVGQ